MKQCRLCKKSFYGRSDKIFCSTKCKSVYNKKLSDVTKSVTLNTDKILHRNRSILLEILGKNGKYKKVDKAILDAKNFNYTYVTAYHLNTQNKMVNYVYDFSWAIFSDKMVAIRRLNPT